ncbi:hypothetical protein MN608_03904 [Microdochium nivale]|nr:hypothetical protein MN608_03904 [Microdochium nivale]
MAAMQAVMVISLHAMLRTPYLQLMQLLQQTPCRRLGRSSRCGLFPSPTLANTLPAVSQAAPSTACLGSTWLAPRRCPSARGSSPLASSHGLSSRSLLEPPAGGEHSTGPR